MSLDEIASPDTRLFRSELWRLLPAFRVEVGERDDDLHIEVEKRAPHPSQRLYAVQRYTVNAAAVALDPCGAARALADFILSTIHPPAV